MAPERDEGTRAVTAYEASETLDRAPSTIHLWAIRYGAVKLGKLDGKVYYDFADLAVIEREIRHGHPVPPTPELRAEIRSRCPLQAAEQVKHAA